MTSRASTKIEPPSILLRVAAFLIDWAVVLLLSVFLSVGAGDLVPWITLLVSLAVYHIGFIAVVGATPGKMAMRIQVLDANGGRLAPDKAILRYLIFFVIVVPAFLPAVTGPLALPAIGGLLLSSVLALRDGQQRTIHDRVAGSVVVKADSERLRDR